MATAWVSTGDDVLDDLLWQHNGVAAVDFATGELVGLSGEMSIKVVDGQHHYAFDYVLPRD